MKLYKVVSKANGRKHDVDFFASRSEAQKCAMFFESIAESNGNFDVEYEVEEPP